MRVRIIKSEAWHLGLTGREFNVTGHAGGYVRVVDTEYLGNGLLPDDYEVVPDTKIVKHDGVEYEVPDWAKFLTRDGTLFSVFAWEKQPVWKDVHNEWAHDLSKPTGMIRCVEPYVKPKPEGNFFTPI